MRFRDKISSSIMRVGSNNLVIIYNLGFLLDILHVAQSDQAEPDASNSNVLKNYETIDNELMDTIIFSLCFYELSSEF